MRAIKNFSILVFVSFFFMVIGLGLVKYEWDWSILFPCGWIARDVYMWMKIKKDE